MDHLVVNSDAGAFAPAHVKLLSPFLSLDKDGNAAIGVVDGHRHRRQQYISLRLVQYGVTRRSRLQKKRGNLIALCRNDNLSSNEINMSFGQTMTFARSSGKTYN